MSTVYVDARSLLLAPSADGQDPAPGDVPLAPRAVKALSYLSEAGHEVVLLGEGPALQRVDELLGPPARASLPALPDDALGWLVTSDPAMGAGTVSRAGLRTVLVGAAPGEVGLAHRTWDAEAPDFIAVALLVLGEEAMPGVADGR